ncbi:MAG: hypothetical protein NTW87_27260 [Planctomycetota bacterium]|nr:hypothetical protein [Planctomycetota bacterium]
MQLCSFHECLADAKTNYVANDGVVPLQSALFLDVAKGDQFARRAGNAVQLDDGKIESRRLAGRHHILNGDHLDLLELRDGSLRQVLYREIAEAARQTTPPASGPHRAK